MAHRGRRRSDIAAGLGAHRRSVNRGRNAYGGGPAGAATPRPRILVGTPPAFRDGIEAVAEGYGAEGCWS
jgi:hypothetical protein